MAVNGNNVNIAAAGPNNTLMFYWAVNGTAITSKCGVPPTSRVPLLP
jgi:hypothetical protein